MTTKYPQYKIVEMLDTSPESLGSQNLRVFYQVQIRRWETGMVKDHDGTGPLYYNTTDGVVIEVGNPGKWMACMDSNGPLIYATQCEALDKLQELRKVHD